MFSENLKKYRLNQKLSKAELARKLNLQYTTYDNYERGTGEPKLNKLIEIANILNVSIDDLVGKNSNNQDEQIQKELKNILSDKNFMFNNDTKISINFKNIDNKYIYLQGNIDKLNQSIDFKYSKTKFLNDIDTLNKNFSKIKQTTIMMNLCNICLLKLGLDIVLYIKSKHKKNDLDVEILSTFEKLFNINLEDFQDIQRLHNSVNE